MIAVSFALPPESSDFVRRLTNGRLHGQEVRIWHTGVGERAAQTFLKSFFADHSPRLLISAGFAGALTDQLKVGDVLLAENFSAPELLAATRGVGFVGRLQTVSEIADTLEARTKLSQETGALAVDMETKFIARACAQHQVPMLSLRAISDTPRAPFSIPAHVLFDLGRQRTPAAKLVFHLLKHPGAIGKLIAIARQVSQARIALTNALEAAILACARSGVFLNAEGEATRFGV